MRKLYLSKIVKLNGIFRNIAIVCCLGMLHTTQAQVSWIMQGTSIAGTADNMAEYGDKSGSAVSLSKDGMTLAVGSPTHTFSGIAATTGGKVAVYSWNGSAWTPKGNALFASNATEQFGGTLSLNANGTCVAVGTAVNFVDGFARVYTFTGGAWTQMGSGFVGTSQDELGKSISLSADGMVVAIGSPNNTNIATRAGKVNVYAWNGSSWLARGSEIQGQTMDDYFGTKVSLSANGNRLAASSPNKDIITDFNVGDVRVFDWDGSAWNLVGNALTGTIENEYFGTTLEISSGGTTLAVASPFYVTSGSTTGIAYVYNFNGSNWVQKGSAIVGVGDESLGNALAISRTGDTLALGARSYFEDPIFNIGKVKIFRWTGSSWVALGTELKGSRAEDYFGTALSMSANGKIVAVGAPGNESNSANDGGRVVVYNLSCAGITTITHQPISQTVCGSTLATLGVTVSGGNATYLWSNTATTQSIQAGAGTYTVTITGECGMAVSNTATVTSLPTTQITLQPQSQTICGSNTATLSVAGTGANITYLWSNGANTPTIQTALAGTYRATVSGTCGLVVSSVVSVTTVASTSIIQQPVSRTVCGSSLATLGVTATGSNLTYLWSNAATTQTIQASAGTYSVTVTGFCGSVSSNTVTVTTIANTQITLQPQSQTICGSNTATLSVAGTGTNITYLWSNGAITPTIQQTIAGSYRATVSGTCGAVNSNNVQVTFGTLPSITGISPGIIIIPEISTANLDVTAIGSNLQYRWSNGATTRTVTGVGAGEYTVTVTGSCGSVVSSNVLIGSASIETTIRSGYQFVTNFGSSGSANNQFSSPNMISIGADGRIFIADRNNHRISVWTRIGDNFSPLTTFGSFGVANNQFNSPVGLHIARNGLIYIGDTENHRISVWSQSGNNFTPYATFGKQGSGVDDFISPEQIATNTNGRIFITDKENDRVSVWTRFGNIYSHSSNISNPAPTGIAIGNDNKAYIIGEPSEALFSLNFWSPIGNSFNLTATFLIQTNNLDTAPTHIGIGPDNKIYLGSNYTSRVDVYSVTGNNINLLARFGNGLQTYIADYFTRNSMGTVNISNFPHDPNHFAGVSGFAIKDDQIYVADPYNHRISVWNAPAPIFFFQVTFDITAPTTFTGSTATLTWPTVDGIIFGVTYCLRISKDRTMGSGVKTVCGLTGNSYKYNPNDPNGRTEAGLEEYYWQVAGVDEEGNYSQWSEVQTFALDANATSISANVTTPKVSIYPNPNNGTWTLESDKAGELSIMNALGSVVYSAYVTTGKTQISIDLPKGIYIVKLGSKINKLVIE